MESATSGKEQFMYIVGQLCESTNVFWELEFEGYHGLRSVNDIPKIGLDTVCCKRLTKSELDHYYGLLKHVAPLIRDAICFQLMSMIMLLDTSNIIDCDDTCLDDIEENEYNALGVYLEDDASSSMPRLTFDESCEMKEPISSQNNQSICNNEKQVQVQTNQMQSAVERLNASNEKQVQVQTRQKPSAVERFKEITLLQKHYMYLLKTRCEQLDDTKIRKFVDPDKGGLRRTMLCFRQLAQYVPVLM